MIRRRLIIALCLILSNFSTAQEFNPPKFRAETIDSKVIIGYGVVIGDVDGDQKPDILLADKKQFVWYQNPTWKRHVLAENLTERDNVCIAARDIDGDGAVEIAVGGQWNPGDTVNSGSVHYLVAPSDRTQKWKPVKLQHEPVVHRMRWVKLDNKKYVLVVAPLHGKGNKGGTGNGVRLLAYHPPQNANDEWKTELLDDSMHVTHNFDVSQWVPETESEEIVWYGKEGARLISYADGKWANRKISHVQGGGEIRLGRLQTDQKFVTTIEPFHGSELVLYRQLNQGTARSGNIPQDDFQRSVLDGDFNQGHAVATGDLFGNGQDQIIAGWRNPNANGKVGIKMYYATNPGVSDWKSVWIDDNGMACEDLRIGDLNGDGKPDIVAAGRSTHNLKIYWNQKNN